MSAPIPSSPWPSSRGSLCRRSPSPTRLTRGRGDGEESIAGCVERAPEGRPAADGGGVPRARDERVRRDPARRRVAREGRDACCRAGSSSRARATRRKALKDGAASPSPTRTAAGRRASSSIDVDAKTGRALRRRSICRSLALPERAGTAHARAPALPGRRRPRRAATSSPSARSRTRIVVEDPIASTPDPRPSRTPRRARNARSGSRSSEGSLYGGAGRRPSAVILGMARLPVASSARGPSRRRRPRGPRGRSRSSGSTRSGTPACSRRSASAEFFDRVNDAVRQYLGARFGFDGLESTTDETMAALRPRAALRARRSRRWRLFLQECDLVKFADVIRRRSRSASARSTQAERIVRSTMPAAWPRLGAGRQRGRREVRAVRGALVALGTLAVPASLAVSSVARRGDAWRSAMWAGVARIRSALARRRRRR